MKVNIGVSARHIHVTKEDVKELFGEGYVLNKKNDLSQPGMYACEETVIIKGPKGTFENVRIVGPERSKTQVEVSKTDMFKLGVDAPIRNSGDLDGASLVTIIGPKGSIERNAVIVAQRHIHATLEEAKAYGFENKKNISIKIDGLRGGVLENVSVRISEDFKLEVHLDTDEANALSVKNGDMGELIIK